MKTEMVPTDQIYQQLLDTADPAVREQIYLEQIVQPWQAMMSMMGRPQGEAQPDPLAGARAWNWLLPDQVDQMADLLSRLQAADAWEVSRDALARAARRFAGWEDRLPIQQVTGWLVLGDPSRSNPLEHGYTGATDWMQPRLIGQFWDPNPENLPRLPGLVAHEMHHLIRMRLFPFDPRSTSVGDYIIIEGTAEAFAADLFGDDKVTFYVSHLSPADFDSARRLMGEGLQRTGFDTIRAYVFGDSVSERYGFSPIGGMPAYGGYTIGYHVVRAYLERTGRSIVEATFTPAVEIIRESGFFEGEG